MQIWLVILLYGLFWGGYQFWGYDRTIKKVLSNPDKYSPRRVKFCKRLTFFPKALLSFFTALAIPTVVLGIIYLIFVVIDLF